MATKLDDTGLDSVTAEVQFTAKTGETPVALVKQPGQGQDTRTGTFEEHRITIYNARPVAEQFDLDRQGFELWDYPTAVKDFFDDEEILNVYYPEMEKLVKEATGCSRVLVFDHTIRVGDPDKEAARKVRAPVRNMHNDFTRRSAPQRVRDLLPDEAEDLLKKRYGSINIWRPIVAPVETKPLAICEYGSISDDDLIAAERHYQGRIGGVYNLSYNPDQRWYYFPKMERDEIVLLKCFDSLEDGTARWTAHGSFDDPKVRPDAPPRESIEIRTLYFYD